MADPHEVDGFTAWGFYLINKKAGSCVVNAMHAQLLTLQKIHESGQIGRKFQ